MARIRLEAWGPLAAFAAELGLPAAGPLVLPGQWVHPLERQVLTGR